MERKVSTLCLKIGMYVSRLDRPSLDTPFALSDFIINDENDIDNLKKFCEYIYINIEKGVEADTYLDEPTQINRHYLDDFLEDGKRQVEYHEQTTAFQEFPVAETALREANIKVTMIMDNLKAGEELDVQAVREAVQPMLDTMIRNSDALLWMLKVHEKDDYTYAHHTDNCALAIAFGKHLGLYKEDLRLLAMGMLLLDVGKTKIPAEIINKPGTLTKEEFAAAKKHVEYGVEILSDNPGISETIISMVLTHHERFDGSGYPRALKDSQIPVFGRIAAIIDVYNAMISKTPYRDAIAPQVVLGELHKWRNKYFQNELVEHFLQCLGEFPTGSLVEMTSGEVGIIVAQNKQERLKPTIMMLLDEQKKECEVSSMVDMVSNPVDSSGLELKILSSLKPGAYGADTSKGLGE